MTSSALGWSLDPAALALILGSGVLYLWAVRRVWRTRGSAAFPRGRAGFFFAGLAALLVALESPVHAYAGRLLSVHMAQHLILTMVAAPLLILGSPALLALQASSRSTRRRFLLPVLRGPVGAFLARPAVGWSLFAAVLWGTHLPAVYDAALHSQ